MRRFLDWTAGQTGNLATGIRRDHHDDAQPCDDLTGSCNLEIQHLIKLLHEIKYHQASSCPLPSAGSQIQREFVEKVHRTLPLFLNVFCAKATNPSTQNSSSLDDSESSANESSKPTSPLPTKSELDKFPDLLPFAFTIARLFVSEVRQRASNKQAGEASLSILQFLSHTRQDNVEIFHEDPRDQLTVGSTTQGWNLLMSLNTLALLQNQQIINLLCDASLPSTLIKCLYLFFDLPTPEELRSNVSNSSLEQSALSNAHEKVHKYDLTFMDEINFKPLIKAFTQLLVQLCANQSAIDELIKKDDLRLLIGISSSQCPKQNKPWRKTAFQAMHAVSMYSDVKTLPPNKLKTV